MRKASNQRIQTSNPSLLFARGVESLVSDHLNRPRYAEHDREQELKHKAHRAEPRGNLFNLLMRQFANS